NKAGTRDVLRAAAVHQPAYAVVDAPDQVPAAVAAVGLPCVVKPVDDSGSDGVLRCDTVAAAVRHAADLLAVTENVRGQRAAGVELGATHVEVRLTDAGAAVIELNARLAGGMIPDLVALATGVNLLEQHLRVHAGLPVRLESSRGRRAGIRFLLAPAAGTLR